mgnify:FL=1
MRINFFKFAILTLLFSFFLNLSLQSYEIKIIKKVGGEIVTNIDIKKEYQYLLALNKEFKNADEDKILNISKQSIINEKVKKNEILKFYLLGKDNEDLINNIVKNLYLGLNINDKKEFEEYLKDYNLTYKEIYDKIEIEILWNQLIYSKYKNQININKKLIREKIKDIKEERLMYNLSEIILLAQTKSQILDEYEKIINHINEFGFENSAILYSQSDSKNEGGLLGWIYEDQLSDLFKKELNSLEIGQITKSINISGGILILKINDIKTEVKEIDTEVIFNNNVKFETEKQLNNFSLIYFNKVKNILINE